MLHRYPYFHQTSVLQVMGCIHSFNLVFLLIETTLNNLVLKIELNKLMPKQFRSE